MPKIVSGNIVGQELIEALGLSEDAHIYAIDFRARVGSAATIAVEMYATEEMTKAVKTVLRHYHLVPDGLTPLTAGEGEHARATWADGIGLITRTP